MTDIKYYEDKLKRIKEGFSNHNSELMLRYYSSKTGETREIITPSDKIAQVIIEHYSNKITELNNELSEYKFKTVENQTKRVRNPNYPSEISW